jgi:small nuclear ribonucleoprotein
VIIKLSASSSSQQQPKRPLSTLQRSINRKVAVRLKSEIEYRGRMSNVDSYMNLILIDAEEFNGTNVLANYGKVVIRGNNVLFIRLEKEF